MMVIEGFEDVDFKGFGSAENSDVFLNPKKKNTPVTALSEFEYHQILLTLRDPLSATCQRMYWRLHTTTTPLA
jgi:hypothetical protein